MSAPSFVPRQLGRNPHTNQFAEAGDEIGVRYADERTGMLVVSHDIDDPATSALIGKKINDEVELQNDGVQQIVRILSITKTAGRMVVPQLDSDVGSAMVLRWIRGWGEKVTAGEPLVVLEAGNHLTEVVAPISGVLNSISRPVGSIVRIGNRLGRIDSEVQRIKVRYTKVRPDGLPECIRIDYQAGFTLLASEWVCPNAPCRIGEKGRAWWLERIGIVPTTIQEALVLAEALPRPSNINTVDIGGARLIRDYEYETPAGGDATAIEGNHNVFLQDEDRKDREKCKRSMKPASAAADLRPPPQWWRRIPQPYGPTRPLIDPFDRHCISSATQSFIRRALELSREFGRQFRTHITLSQASANLCMAYSINEAPTIEELKRFFPSIWPSNDLIIVNHFDALAGKIGEMISHDWLAKLIDPRIAAVVSCDNESRQATARHLDIGASGYINSGLVWAANGFLFDPVIIPAVDVGGIFMAHYNTGGSKAASQRIGPQFTTFDMALREILRTCINETRVEIGLPRIGEGWFMETDLFYRIKALLPGDTVVQHGRPGWLGRQHFDIWIPNRNVAIEYQGEQHFLEIAIFGGRDGLAKTRERDQKKRELCKQNGVHLIEIAFNDDLRDAWLTRRLKEFDV